MEIILKIEADERLIELLSYFVSAIAHKNGMNNTVEAIKEIDRSETDKSPAPAVSQQVPTTAKTYTIDEISRAAVGLMDAGKQAELMDVLKSFGVNALPELAKEQYSEFVLKIRELGAQI